MYIKQIKNQMKIIISETREIKIFYMQTLTADEKSIYFYRKIDVENAGNTQPLWTYKRNKH